MLLIAVSLKILIQMDKAEWLLIILGGLFIVGLSFKDPVFPIGTYFFHSAIRNLIQLPSAIASIVGPILILCAFLGVITQVIRNHKKIAYSFCWLDLMIVFLSLLIVISTQYSLASYKDLSGLIRELLGVLGIYFAMRLGLNSPDQLQKLAWFTVIGFAFLAANALVSKQVEFGSLAHVGSNPLEIDAFRLNSGLTFNDPNYFAWTLLMPIALAAVLLIQVKKWLVRILSGACFLVILMALVVSLSRGMWIALVIMMVIFVFRMPARLRLPSLIVVLLVGWMVYSFGWDLIETRLQDRTGPGDTMHQRLLFWRTAIDVFRQHPLIGVGYGNFPIYNPAGNVVHNTFLSFFAETGFMGGLSLISIYWLAWGNYHRAQKRFSQFGKDKPLLLSIGLEIGLIGQVVGLMSLNFGLNPHIILGITLAGVLVNMPLWAEKTLESAPTAQVSMTYNSKFGGNKP